MDGQNKRRSKNIAFFTGTSLASDKTKFKAELKKHIEIALIAHDTPFTP